MENLTWNRHFYEDAVLQCNGALLRNAKHFEVDGRAFSTDNGKYMLVLFGNQFGYESTLKDNFITLKKINQDDTTKR